MNEAEEEGVPDFLSRLKPLGAPLGLRELVTATVEKELGQTGRNARWFTQTEWRCFQIAGSLLLASIAFCSLVELGEQSRMTRLDFKKEIPGRDQDLFPFLACHDPSKLHEWFLSYQRIARPSPQSLSQIQNAFLQNIETDPEFKKYLRGYHGFF